MTHFHSALALGLLAATVLSADEPTPPKAQTQSEYRRPELVAIAWQQARKPATDSAPIAIWRPDGSPIEGEELDWLRKDLGTINAHWWNPDELRPLVFILGIDDHAKTPQTLMGSLLVNGQSHSNGSGSSSSPNFLAKLAIAPNLAQVAAWPHEVDIEVRVPIAEPETLKSFARLPDGPIELDRGVRWYVDPSRGSRRQGAVRASGFPAAVLEIDRKIADPLSNFGAKVWLKDGGILSGDYVTVIDEAGTVEVRVSRPLEESNPIVNVEFTRLRHRLERYEKLPTRLDLKPEDPKPQPVAPAAEVFKRL